MTSLADWIGTTPMMAHEFLNRYHRTPFTLGTPDIGTRFLASSTYQGGSLVAG